MIYDGGDILFRGRKQRSQIPPKLYESLEETFLSKTKIFNELFGQRTAILFGEGFGGYISGGTIPGEKYRDSCDFILFAVWTSDPSNQDSESPGIWANWEEVKEIAERLQIKVVPSLGIFNREEAVQIVKRDMREGNITSKFGSFKPEGIVATAHPFTLLDNGIPLRWKLKIADYDRLEKWKEQEEKK